MSATNAIVERYDTYALDYARYWAPVLEPTSGRLLDEVASFVERAEAGSTSPVRVLDVGSGTGVLALAAASRWPRAQVVASDAAGGMLDIARERARAAGLNDVERLAFVVGEAASLPLPDATVDVVVSSFVFQLVPDRLAALREALRVLRPGGRLAYVTWLDREARRPFPPTDEFDEAVLELGVEEPDLEEEVHAGDVPSARSAANELRRAGFRRVGAREDELVYQWLVEGYLEYKLAYDERSLLSRLSDEQQRQLEESARERLGRLPADDFRWHAPIVFARGERPRQGV